MEIRTRVPRSWLSRAKSRPRRFDPLFGGDFGALLDGLRSDVDAVRPPAFRPRIDVATTADAVVLTAELPGLESDDFEVVVEDDVLTIKGEKKLALSAESESSDDAPPRTAAFARSFRIPFEFEADAVSGRYRNGLLTLTVPRPAEPESQVRNIPVTTD